MARCKECLHNRVCGGFIPSDLDRDVFDYCREGRTDEIPDIEERCNNFKCESRFIELPCKIGDTVYIIDECDDEYGEPYVLDVEVLSLTIENLGIGIELSLPLGFRQVCWCVIGETVFLTREEAEKALAERRG